MKRTYDFGVIIYHVKPDQYEKAIELGKSAFFEQYGYPADIVALPRCVDIPINLPLCDTPAPAGCVIVGAAKKIQYRQETLL